MDKMYEYVSGNETLLTMYNFYETHVTYVRHSPP